MLSSARETISSNEITFIAKRVWSSSSSSVIMLRTVSRVASKRIESGQRSKTETKHGPGHSNHALAPKKMIFQVVFFYFLLIFDFYAVHSYMTQVAMTRRHDDDATTRR
ncbi:hypothetical protein FRC19_004847 [Serendipita sp. 401]|nr:hypothetical protein FRC19_004847 [Serendipita sp. 401]KAG9031539.1 hypothetical protein FS842_004243 [Serendipita sp. 407]